MLYSKSVLSYLDAWRIFFNCSTIQKYCFLTLRDKNCILLQLSYFKDSSWLSHIGQLVILYARVTRAIFNYASIGKYRQYFSPVEYTQYLYSHCQIEIYWHIFANCLRFAYSLLIDLSLSIKDLVNFLKNIQVYLSFFIKNDLLLKSYYECSNSLLFCFYR